ncbi:MAG TPA: hypothetical protein VIM59_09845 [Cellvibrio sp.]
MFTVKKAAKVFSAIVLSSVSMASFAETFEYWWVANPYAYTSVRDCTWQYIGSSGGSWGSQFSYVSTGSCPWTTMKVNHHTNATNAIIELN